MARVNSGGSEDYEAKINELKAGLDKANDLRIQAKTRLEELAKQEQEIISQLAELGVKPEELDREIASLDEQIKNLVAEIESLIPWDLIGTAPEKREK
ncbi:hypothetical protein [Desulfotomaculum copahuensis]|uniref:Uncharacterized protein n=1 Tax=Desulfotomaculum copahuensis TaxID=1838280 RepID=A0A1B7LHS7_9FIRM|nr:hypothetical protein [Desulfotomaculum copahuensis]OAT85753.1 hypothetical protein A6M21_04445 [Desulfotomaculum copahuensis]